ncbi:hypothetical protein V6N12_047878 [Hibiscus sabdariffa]|uniref:Uncharacterized protein n=1 Tax=Hibiscus sabdariffa TaxID=183260 RepID=A0ABR2CU97_9ROSI
MLCLDPRALVLWAAFHVHCEGASFRELVVHGPARRFGQQASSRSWAVDISQDKSATFKVQSTNLYFCLIHGDSTVKFNLHRTMAGYTGFPGGPVKGKHRLYMYYISASKDRHLSNEAPGSPKRTVLPPLVKLRFFSYSAYMYGVDR